MLAGEAQLAVSFNSSAGGPQVGATHLPGSAGPRACCNLWREWNPEDPGSYILICSGTMKMP
jgi:hypothetical protein